MYVLKIEHLVMYCT